MFHFINLKIYIFLLPSYLKIRGLILDVFHNNMYIFVVFICRNVFGNLKDSKSLFDNYNYVVSLCKKKYRYLHIILLPSNL